MQHEQRVCTRRLGAALTSFTLDSPCLVVRFRLLQHAHARHGSSCFPFYSHEHSELKVEYQLTCVISTVPDHD